MGRQEMPQRSEAQHRADTNQDSSSGAAPVASFLTTEHFTLQTASSATVFESNGRTTLFLSAVSSAVVALAFIGQVSQMGATFYIFALVLFPSLFFVGIFTFVQVLDTAVQNVGYRRGMNRIRHYYVETAPDSESYFIRATSNDAAASQSIIDPVTTPSALGMFLTTAGMVAVVNSVLAGVFVGMLVQVLFAPTLTVCTAIGIACFLVAVVVQYIYQARIWADAEQHFKSTFPAEKNSP